MKSLFYLNVTLRRLTFSCLLLIACFPALTAQDTTVTRTHEIGLRLTRFNLEDFSVIYKKQRLNQENRYTRIRFIVTDINFSQQEGSDASSFNTIIGAAIGTERRVSLNNRIQFLHGPEWNTFVQYQHTDFGSLQNTSQQNQLGISLGFGYVLGLQYNFNERFYINLETIPSISVSYNTTKVKFIGFNEKVTQWNANAGSNSDAVALTFAYRFGVTR